MLLNTFVCGTLSLYSFHRSASTVNGVLDPRWHCTLRAFLEASKFRGSYSGDDSVAIGRGLNAQVPNAVAVMLSLGYVAKAQVATSLWGVNFLGCYLMLVEERIGQEWQQAVKLVPMPHRFLTTLGWALEMPHKPAVHLAGVGLGWCQALAVVPGYGSLCRNMAMSGGVTFHPDGSIACVPVEVKRAKENYFAPWADYSAALCGGAMVRLCEGSLSTVCQALRVSEHEVLQFALDLAAVDQFPCYIGTASVHAVMQASQQVG
jgi:hypothetical protein